MYFKTERGTHVTFDEPFTAEGGKTILIVRCRGPVANFIYVFQPVDEEEVAVIQSIDSPHRLEEVIGLTDVSSECFAYREQPHKGAMDHINKAPSIEDDPEGAMGFFLSPPIRPAFVLGLREQYGLSQEQVFTHLFDVLVPEEAYGNSVPAGV